MERINVDRHFKKALKATGMDRKARKCVIADANNWDSLCFHIEGQERREVLYQSGKKSEGNYKKWIKWHQNAINFLVSEFDRRHDVRPLGSTNPGHDAYVAWRRTSFVDYNDRLMAAQHAEAENGEHEGNTFRVRCHVVNRPEADRTPEVELKDGYDAHVAEVDDGFEVRWRDGDKVRIFGIKAHLNQSVAESIADRLNEGAYSLLKMRECSPRWFRRKEENDPNLNAAIKDIATADNDKLGVAMQNLEDVIETLK